MAGMVLVADLVDGEGGLPDQALDTGQEHGGA